MTGAAGGNGGPALAAAPVGKVFVMRLSPRLTLNNGVLIDRLGFGLYKVPPADAASLVTMAVETGYRHFDTAAMYGNETGVGKGIGALSGFEGTGGGPGETAPYVSREDLFVTTKVWNDDHGYDATHACVRHLDVQPRPGIHRPLPDPLAVRARVACSRKRTGPWRRCTARARSAQSASPTSSRSTWTGSWKRRRWCPP